MSTPSKGNDVDSTALDNTTVIADPSSSRALSVHDSREGKHGDTLEEDQIRQMAVLRRGLSRSYITEGNSRSLYNAIRALNTQVYLLNRKKMRQSRRVHSASGTRATNPSQSESDGDIGIDGREGEGRRHKRSSARPEARRRAEDTKSVDLITHLLAANIFAFRAISKGKSKARYVSDSEDEPRSTVDKRRAKRSTTLEGKRKVRYNLPSDESCQESDVHLDKYDSQDSFIDDSAVCDDEASSQSGTEDERAPRASSPGWKSPSPPPSTQPPKPVRSDPGRTSRALSASVTPAIRPGQPSSSAYSPQTPTVRRQFGLLAGTPSTSTPSPVVRGGIKDDGPRLDDLYYSEVTSLPDECEVMDPELQDELLKDSYKELPNLRAGTFESWSEAAGPGMVRFSGWADICARMSYDSCYNAINFTSHRNFVNPSRVSPLSLLVRSVPGARTRYYLYTKERMPAMCVSSVYCKESHLLAPPDRGLRQKWLSGIFHSQEWERCVGLVCTMFKHRYVSAQLCQDAMQFSTKASFANRCACIPFISCDGVLNQKIKVNSQQEQTPASSMFVKVRSPSTGTKGRSRTAPSADDFSLDFEADGEY
ncbi:hypothetical protein MD484_g8554, partial [Candolleomyces efflorescens]